MVLGETGAHLKAAGDDFSNALAALATIYNKKVEVVKQDLRALHYVELHLFFYNKICKFQFMIL